MTNLTIRRPTSALTGFDLRPFDALMREFEQSFRDFFDPNGRAAVGPNRVMPMADIAETDKEYLVSVELPGLELADVEVRLNGDELIVSGERKERKEEKDRRWRRIETWYGTFERRFELPSEVRSEPEALKATFHNGMLEVRLQKREPKPVTKIPVKPV